VLEELRSEFSNKEKLKVKLSHVYMQEDVAQRGELNVGSYIYASVQVNEQMRCSINQLDSQIIDLNP
jgi:hypothetical protein